MAAERLHQELASIPGLAQVSVLQLHDLAWKTKELVFVALFREHGTSVAVADKLLAVSKARKLERKADKLAEPVNREAMRKSEDSYRSDFMQLAATELARLGAPALITWQKLVFDKDCCAQAFRLLLTRIKSSRRSGTRSNNELGDEPVRVPRRRVVREDSSRGSMRDDDDGPETAANGIEDDQSEDSHLTQLSSQPIDPSFKKARQLRVKRSIVRPAADNSDWNFDTSVGCADPEEDARAYSSNQFSDEKRSPARSSGGVGGASIVLERTAPSRQPSSLTTKLKKSQLQSLQHENASLSGENTKLRDEIEHLQAVIACLQESNHLVDESSFAAFEMQRMRLLQAQNIQLQRHISLMQDAALGYQQLEASLSSALQHWRDVVDRAQHDAKAAGADQSGSSPDGKMNGEPVQWMFAVPQKLMSELARVEEQIRSASTNASATSETKLHISDKAASFLRDKQSTIHVSDIHSGRQTALRQLNPTRIKLLEDQLSRVARSLEMLSTRLLKGGPSPKLVGRSHDQEDDMVRMLSDVTSSVKSLLMEVGAFGTVVQTPTAPFPGSGRCVPELDDGSKLTIPYIIKMLSASSSGVTAKERDRQVKVVLKQLQAHQAWVESDAKASRREASYWKQAWETQADIAGNLLKAVDRLGRKKMAWVSDNVMSPMNDVAKVFASFQRARQEGTTRQNPFLPLLIETLTTQHTQMCASLQQWEMYDRSVQDKLAGLVADFEANIDALSASMQPRDASNA